MRHLLVIIIIIIHLHYKVKAQVQLEFNPTWNERPLVMGNYHQFSDGKDSIRFEVFKFYITNIRLSKNGNDVYCDSNNHHLINLSVSNKIHLNIPTSISFDSIHFKIGTDSFANTSGAMKGDLDPMHGMYWAWQSGYINVKIEGISSACRTRKNAFQYHLGGYLGEYKTQQKLSFYNTSNQFKINISVNEIIQPETLLNTPEVMSPGVLAVKFMQQFKNSFRLAK